MAKRKTIFTPHVDTGDFVDRDQCRKSAAYREEGGTEELHELFQATWVATNRRTSAPRRARHPELLIERAVRGMIPHNRLGRRVYRKLKVYRGDSHPHAAQQPQAVKLRKS